MYILLHGKPTSNDFTLQLTNQHSLQVLAYVWTSCQQSQLSPTTLSRGSLLLTLDQVRLWYSYGSIHTNLSSGSIRLQHGCALPITFVYSFSISTNYFQTPGDSWQASISEWSIGKCYCAYFWIGGHVPIVVILFSYIADKTGAVSVAALTYSLMGAGYLAGTVLVPVYLMKFSLNHYLLQLCTH